MVYVKEEVCVGWSKQNAKGVGPDSRAQTPHRPQLHTSETVWSNCTAKEEET